LKQLNRKMMLVVVMMLLETNPRTVFNFTA